MLQNALKKSSPNKSRKRVPGTELPGNNAKLTETTHIHSQLFLLKGAKRTQQSYNWYEFLSKESTYQSQMKETKSVSNI